MVSLNNPFDDIIVTPCDRKLLHNVVMIQTQL